MWIIEAPDLDVALIELGGNIAEIAYPTRRRDQMEAGLFSKIVN